MTAPKVRLWQSFLKFAKANRVPQARWPKAPDVLFERMSGDLRRAVESAVRAAADHAEIADWAWDHYEQVFTFSVGILADFDGTNIDVTMRLYFNPKRAWLDEIERVMAEAEKHVRKIRAALERKNT